MPPPSLLSMALLPLKIALLLPSPHDPPSPPLPLLFSPIEARRHSSIDLHCLRKLPIFRSFLHRDPQLLLRSSILVAIALDFAIILGLLGHRTPPPLLVSSILLLLLQVLNLMTIGPRHRLKFRFFRLFPR